MIAKRLFRMVKTISVIFFLGVVVSWGNSLTIIAKLKNDRKGIPGVISGIPQLDSFNEYYCCQKIEKLYKNIKDPVLAKKLGIDRVYILTLGCNIDDTAAAIRAYMNTGRFEYVEINSAFTSSSTSHTPFYPNDPAFSLFQWALNNKGDTSFWKTKEDVDIDMPEGWGIEQGDSSLVIAILDSGIKNWHGEFDGRLWKNESEIPGDGIDNDKNGYVDDVYGWDFAYGDTILSDDRGHGTAVASIIAANANNGQTVAGVNLKSKIMILKITDVTGKAYSSSIASAIQYAVDNGAKVINFSHASPTKLVLVSEAIEYAYQKSVLICAGSGNDNADSVYYPAKYPHVIAAGATDILDKRCKNWQLSDSTIGGSNYGDSLDVVAPGEQIIVIDYRIGDTPTRNGTSYATAFVTGLASLLISQNPAITPDILTQIIESTAEDQVGDPSEDTKGYDKYYGYGRINAYNALLKGEELKTGKKPKALVSKDLSKWITWSRYNRLLTISRGDVINRNSLIFIRVVDASGKVIKSVSLTEQSGLHTVSLPLLSSGVYLYSIKCEDATWSGKILN
jgi:subtilisin family serine protease